MIQSIQETVKFISSLFFFNYIAKLSKRRNMYQLSSQKPNILLDDILNTTQTEESIKNFKKQSFQKSLMMSTIRRDRSSQLDSDEEQDDKELISALESNKIIRGLVGNTQGSSSYMTKTPSVSASESEEESSADKKLDNYIKSTRDTFSDYYSKIQKDKELEEMRNKLKNIGDDSEDEKQDHNGYSIDRFNDNITPIKPNLNMTNFSFLDNSKKRTTNSRLSMNSEENIDFIGDIKPKNVQNENKLSFDALNQNVVGIEKEKKQRESSLNVNTQLIKSRYNQEKPIENFSYKDQYKEISSENQSIDNQNQIKTNKEAEKAQITIETRNEIVKIKEIDKYRKNHLKNQKISSIDNKKNDNRLIRIDINPSDIEANKGIINDKTPISIFNAIPENISKIEKTKIKDKVENEKDNNKIDIANKVGLIEGKKEKDMLSHMQPIKNKADKNSINLKIDDGLKSKIEENKPKSEKFGKKAEVINDKMKIASSPLNKMEIENTDYINNFDDDMNYIHYDQPDIILSPMKSLSNSSPRRRLVKNTELLSIEKKSENLKKRTSKSPKKSSKSPKKSSKSPKKSSKSPKKFSKSPRNSPKNVSSKEFTANSIEKTENTNNKTQKKNKSKKLKKPNEIKATQELPKNDDDTSNTSPIKKIIKKKIDTKRRLNKIKEVSEIEEDGNKDAITTNTKIEKPRLKSVQKRKRENITTRQKYLELYDRTIGGKYSHIIEKQIEIKHEYFGPNQRYPRRNRVQTMCFWRNEKPIYMNRGDGIEMVGLQFMDEELHRFKELLHVSGDDKSDDEQMPILKRMKVIL